MALGIEESIRPLALPMDQGVLQAVPAGDGARARKGDESRRGKTSPSARNAEAFCGVACLTMVQ